MSTTYQPANLPDDPKQLPAALAREFNAIKRAMEDANPSLRLVTLHKAPARVLGGMLIRADGVDFKPDGVNGPGLYIRDEANTTWTFLVAI